MFLQRFFIMAFSLLHRRRQWQPTPVLLPGKSHGQRSLVGCSPWGHKESDTTERLPFHLSASCVGEGNGNPLQCSCLENPRNGSLVGCRLWGRTESDTTEATQQQQQQQQPLTCWLYLIRSFMNLHTEQKQTPGHRKQTYDYQRGKRGRERNQTGINICCCSVAQSRPTLYEPMDARPAHQASLSLTISQSLSKFMSIVAVMPSSRLIL